MDGLEPNSLVQLFTKKPSLAFNNYTKLLPYLGTIDRSYLETLCELFDPSQPHLGYFIGRQLFSKKRFVPLILFFSAETSLYKALLTVMVNYFIIFCVNIICSWRMPGKKFHSKRPGNTKFMFPKFHWKVFSILKIRVSFTNNWNDKSKEYMYLLTSVCLFVTDEAVLVPWLLLPVMER